MQCSHGRITLAMLLGIALLVLPLLVYFTYSSPSLQSQVSALLPDGLVTAPAATADNANAAPTSPASRSEAAAASPAAGPVIQGAPNDSSSLVNAPFNHASQPAQSTTPSSFSQQQPVQSTDSRPPAYQRNNATTANASQPSADNSATGILTIRGKVLDETGLPVAGMPMTATSLQLFNDDGYSATERPAQQSAFSGPDGTYQFFGLPAGEYLIETEAWDPYLPARISVRAGVEQADILVKEQTRQLLLYGQVFNQHGEPLSNIRVAPQGQADNATAHTDDAGHYSLMLSLKGQASTYFIRFSHQDYRQRDIRLEPGMYQQREEVQLNAELSRLQAQASLSGRLTDSRGRPIEGETVRLNSVRLKKSYQAKSDAAGNFSFNDLAISPDYHLRIYPQGAYRKLEQAPLAINAGKQRLNLTLEPLTFGRVSGQMTDEEGNGIAGFALMLYSNNANQAPLQVTGDGYGYFSLDQVPAGELTFATRSSPHFSIRGIHLPAGGEAYAELVLDWGPHQLQGQIVDSRGNAVPVSVVQLIQSVTDAYGVNSRSVRRTAADSQGRFLFTQLGPGMHTVYIGKTPGFDKAQIEHHVPLDGGQVMVELVEVME